MVMAEAGGSVVDGGNLLYPELLSREELVQILLSRCVRKQLIEGLEKYKLVDLFQRIVLPLPQRIYSDNRRGKMLTALRKKTERNIKSVENTLSEGSPSVKLSSIPGREVQSSHEKHTSNKSHDSLDHIIINDRRKRPKVEEIRKEPVEVPKISNTESKSSTVIKLKRPRTIAESPSTKTKEVEEEDKKKKRRIVWP